MSDAPGKRSSRQRAPQDDYETEATGTFGRALYTDRRSGDRMQEEMPTRSGGRSSVSDDGTHRTSRGALPTTQYTNFYSGPKANDGISSKLPFIVAGAVILVILIIVLVFIFGGNGEGDDETPNVPVTGVTDDGQSQTDNGDGNSDNTDPTPTPAAVAPTEMEVIVTVADGQTVWVDVLDGDAIVEGSGKEISGGSITAKSTGTVTVYLGSTDGVTITVNGEDQKVDNTYFTFTFSDILADWTSKNGGGADSDGTGGGDSSGDNSGSDSGN